MKLVEMCSGSEVASDDLHLPPNAPPTTRASRRLPEGCVCFVVREALEKGRTRKMRVWAIDTSKLHMAA
jgi:hypothetical protein